MKTLKYDTAHGCKPNACTFPNCECDFPPTVVGDTPNESDEMTQPLHLPVDEFLLSANKLLSGYQSTNTTKNKKESNETETHPLCLKHGCQETAGFKGGPHEGLDMCEDGCVWYYAEKKKNIAYAKAMFGGAGTYLSAGKQITEDEFIKGVAEELTNQKPKKQNFCPPLNYAKWVKLVEEKDKEIERLRAIISDFDNSSDKYAVQALKEENERLKHELDNRPKEWNCQ